MKNWVTAILFVVSAVATAETLQELPKSRSIFDPPEAVGTIKKLQVDLIEKGMATFAKVKVLGSDGKTVSLQLICDKINKNEFNCRRGDNLGGFDILVVPSPRLTLSYFSADKEDADKDTIAIKSKDHKLVIIEGKTGAVALKDSF